MEIKWRRPKGTENFNEAQMLAFYSARSEYVRYLQANKVDDITEQEIDDRALQTMTVMQ